MDFLIFVVSSCLNLNLKLKLGMDTAGTTTENALLLTDGTELLLTNSTKLLLAEV